MTPADELECQALLDTAGCGGRTVLSAVRGLVEDYLRLTAERARPDRERLLAEVAADPWLTVSMVRDACLDEGLEASARGWGWIAAAEKWPIKIGRHWGWVGMSFSCGLPPRLGTAIGAPIDRYPDQLAALQAVVRAIAAGKWQPSDERRAP